MTKINIGFSIIITNRHYRKSIEKARSSMAQETVGPTKNRLSLCLFIFRFDIGYIFFLFNLLTVTDELKPKFVKLAHNYKAD
jgi:hypothetical protein